MFKFLNNKITAKDSICGMNVNQEKTEFKTDYSGKTYYFCSKGCKSIFDANKEMYL